ncbi:7990_t:CDS:1, partial [Acaulospora morrowiae]
KNNGSISGRSRTSSWSGTSSRVRSRANSISAGQSSEGFRVEALTGLPKDQPFSTVTRRGGAIARSNNKETDYDSGYQGDKEDDENRNNFS